MTVVNIERRAGIQNAIALASQRTGVDFNYLMGQAQVESGFNAGARAGTSSATGLYQFIEQSWLGVVKAHGSEHGMGWAADSIHQGSNGRYYVADGATRQAILGLRNDPTAASLMAAEHASDNKDMLEASLGRDATGTDLYMAHFLGIGGAKKFLKAMDAAPDTNAAALFPGAARANRNVFYSSDGSPRSLGEVYRRFAGKLDKGAASVGATGLASGTLDTLSAMPGLSTMPGLSADPNVEVVMGNEAQGGDRAWLASTLHQFRSAAQPSVNLMRPNPQNARLAYLMLARMGGV